jgi:hypothetical protein
LEEDKTLMGQPFSSTGTESAKQACAVQVCSICMFVIYKKIKKAGILFSVFVINRFSVLEMVQAGFCLHLNFFRISF